MDAAARSGSVRRVVIVSSMGGTQVDNFLNTMGGGGDVGSANILLWKRKAEMYLVARSPELEHVVVHPGGLLDKPGGERELLVGVDDRLLDGDRRSVPRADVARVVCGALLDPSAVAVSFDLASREPGGRGTAGRRGRTKTSPSSSRPYEAKPQTTQSRGKNHPCRCRDRDRRRKGSPRARKDGDERRGEWWRREYLEYVAFVPPR